MNLELYARDENPPTRLRRYESIAAAIDARGLGFARVLKVTRSLGREAPSARAAANLGRASSPADVTKIARALAEVHSADIEAWSGQIASHFEHAGMAEDAIEHYGRAAAYARQRYADAESSDLLRRALALCRGFPESDRRLSQELDLLEKSVARSFADPEDRRRANIGDFQGLGGSSSRKDT